MGGAGPGRLQGGGKVFGQFRLDGGPQKPTNQPQNPRDRVGRRIFWNWYSRQCGPWCDKISTRAEFANGNIRIFESIYVHVLPAFQEFRKLPLLCSGYIGKAGPFSRTKTEQPESFLSLLGIDG